jgi:hypothetical protein
MYFRIGWNIYFDVLMYLFGEFKHCGASIGTNERGRVGNETLPGGISLEQNENAPSVENAMYEYHVALQSVGFVRFHAIVSEFSLIMSKSTLILRVCINYHISSIRDTFFVDAPRQCLML